MTVCMSTFRPLSSTLTGGKDGRVMLGYDTCLGCKITVSKPQVTLSSTGNKMANVISNKTVGMRVAV